MKRLTNTLLILALILMLVTPAYAASAKVIPTFSITGVVTDTSVTITTYNFPANDNFDVLMNYIGTRGVGGIKVATIASGAGGSFQATFNIPDALKGLYQIAIRLQSNTGSGYYAYNWFYNNSAGGTGGPGGYISYPTFTITAVTRDVSVSIKTQNMPSNDSFDVLMNYMGTRGVGGIKVATFNSGAGGTLTFTFNIPAALIGQYQIAIRLQSNTGSGYYAYNWFYNNTTGGSGGPGSGYIGYPTFMISKVVRDSSVTIITNNLPPNDKFQVLMGPMGTRGINGYPVTVIDSGAGGVQTLTFNTPPQLYGSFQISIRLQSTTGTGFYAYNWFYNNTTP
jgi:uncharacterized membrane protein